MESNLLESHFPCHGFFKGLLELAFFTVFPCLLQYSSDLLNYIRVDWISLYHWIQMPMRSQFSLRTKSGYRCSLKHQDIISLYHWTQMPMRSQFSTSTKNGYRYSLIYPEIIAIFLWKRQQRTIFHVNLAHFFAPKIMAIRDTGLRLGISLEYSTGQSRYPKKNIKNNNN